MAEPRIQYARTSDGVNIAFYVLGEGMPVMVMPWIPWSHLEREWAFPELRRIVEAHLHEGNRMVIRYDHRGSGLSDRDVSDLSLDTYSLDLEAVVDHLSLKRFALVGRGSSAPVAISYTARNPERVSRLVLAAMSYARASDYFARQIERIYSLIEVDWQLFTETAAHAMLGWSRGEEAQKGAAFLRDCVTQQEALAASRAIQEFDASGLLSQIRAPALVVHNKELEFPKIDLAKGLAASIPNARLVIAEDTQRTVRAYVQFLGEGEDAPAAPELPEGMAVLLFADIAESTALTEQLGDAAFRAKARELDTSLRAVIRECSGTPVEGKLVGDGVLAVFTSARQAIGAALACGRAGDGAGLPVHLGLHAGDVIREEGNVYGGAVNIAARISALSAPGEVLVSDIVRGLARTSAGASFEDRGDHELKGVGDPVRVYEVRWRDE